jgi:FkbM family methyltransferase
MRRFQRGGYEEALRRALESAVRPGDVVWDVGANVGLDSRMFSDWVGPDGSVEAFEPSGPAREALDELELPNVTVHGVALGDRATTLELHLSAHSMTNSLVGGDGGGGPTTPVTVVRGDDLCLRQPQVIKIDVEGFEEEVIQGMLRTLQQCRAVFCEIHFAVLERRGETYAPRRIERLLGNNGFSVDWLDTSHLVGRR